jgi:hypothetical protein
MHYNWNKDQKAQILEIGFLSPFGRVDLRNHIRERKSETFGTINSKKKPTSDWMRKFKKNIYAFQICQMS